MAEMGNHLELVHVIHFHDVLLLMPFIIWGGFVCCVFDRVVG